MRASCPRSCKEIGSLTNARHSRESGNPLRRFRKKKTGRYCGRRLRIPAFAGITKYYSVVIVFYNAGASAIRLSRSETPDFFTRSFAGMTSIRKAVRFLRPLHRRVAADDMVVGHSKGASRGDVPKPPRHALDAQPARRLRTAASRRGPIPERERPRKEKGRRETRRPFPDAGMRPDQKLR